MDSIPWTLLTPFGQYRIYTLVRHTSILDQLHLSPRDSFRRLAIWNVDPAEGPLFRNFINEGHFNVRFFLAVLNAMCNYAIRDTSGIGDKGIGDNTLKTMNPLAQLGGSSPSLSETCSSESSPSTLRDHRVCHFKVETPEVKRRSTGIIAIFSDKRYVRYFSENTNFASEVCLFVCVGGAW